MLADKVLDELCEILDSPSLNALAFEYAVAERWDLVVIVARELKRRAMADGEKTKVVMREAKQGGFD